MLACRVCRARAPRRRDVSPFASRDNELLCPVGRLLFGSRDDVATEIPDTLPSSFLPSLLSFEAGGIVAFRLHLAHNSNSFLFLRLETDLVECRTRDTIRFPVLFFIARRNWIGKFRNRVSSTLRFLGCFRSLEAVWV